MSPRPLASEDLILRATIDILAEHGVDGLAVDTVAAAAGVSKATIYRRWGSRTQLIHAAISSLQRPLKEPDTGSLRGDLTFLLGQLVAYVNGRDSARVFTSFVEAAAREPELEALRRRTISAARAAYERALRRGIERGELAPGTDLGLVVDLLMAPVIFRGLIARRPVRVAYAEAVIDTVLTAFGPLPASDPLPG